MQVKRIHEYKRQLLNVLGIIWRYDQIKRMTPEQKEQVQHLCCLFVATELAAGTLCTNFCCQSYATWCNNGARKFHLL